MLKYLPLSVIFGAILLGCESSNQSSGCAIPAHLDQSLSCATYQQGVDLVSKGQAFATLGDLAAANSYYKEAAAVLGEDVCVIAGGAAADKKIQLEWLLEGASRDITDCQTGAGALYLGTGQLAEAEYWLTKAANNEDKWGALLAAGLYADPAFEKFNRQKAAAYALSAESSDNALIKAQAKSLRTRLESQ